MDWRRRAACLAADPELFFTVGTTALAGEQATEAKAVCAGCPVRRECLDWALVTKQDHGVWGGLDEFERRAERHAGWHDRSNYRERRRLEYMTPVGEIAALAQLPLARSRLPGHSGLSDSGAGSIRGAGAAEGAGR